MCLDLCLRVDDAHGTQADVTLREWFLAVRAAEHHRLLPAGWVVVNSESKEGRGQTYFRMEVEDW
jgi:hypothetical protein